jgi:hypothetical protein
MRKRLAETGNLLSGVIRIIAWDVFIFLTGIGFFVLVVCSGTSMALLINGGAPFTNNPVVNLVLENIPDICLSVTVHDDLGGPQELECTQDPQSYTLPDGDGLRTIDVDIKYSEPYECGTTYACNPHRCGTGTCWDSCHDWQTCYRDAHSYQQNMITLDTIAPSTTDNAPIGWQTSDFSVTLTCGDGAGSGCSETRYQIDGGSEQTGTSVDITTDGDHTVSYYSIDNATNQESPANSVHAMLDKTAPEVSNVTPSGTTYDAYPTIAADYLDSASGINPASASLSLDSGPALSTCVATASHISCSSSHLLSGAHTIGGSVSDNVGHSSPIIGSFTLVYLPVRLAGTSPAYFSAVQDAYDAAETGDTIECQARNFAESLLFDRDVSVFLSGGYNDEYTSNSGTTSVSALVISNGTVTVENLVIF